MNYENSEYHRLIQGCRYNRVHFINEAIDNGTDPSVNDDEAIQAAAIFGHYEVVNRLLEDPRVDPTHAVRCAVMFDHPIIVYRLLEDSRVDPTCNGNTTMRYAAANGHYEVINRLLKYPRVDPSSEGDYALTIAAQNGHYEVVKRLIEDPRVDPGIISHEHRLIQNILKSEDYWFIFKRRHWGTCKELNDLQTQRMNQLKRILIRLPIDVNVVRIIYRYLI